MKEIKQKPGYAQGTSTPLVCAHARRTQKDDRIESHIFVSFLSYCLQVTLKNKAKIKAPGLTPRAILEKFKSMQMIDVHLPTTDGRTLILPRTTQPEKDLQLLLHQLNLTLPDQPPPRLEELNKKCGADL